MIFASNNKGKIKQTKKLFKDKTVVGLREYGLDYEVDETGKTFEENAVKKAKEIHDLTGEAVLADDSGICIDCFDGWPGVYTHRCFGPDISSEEWNRRVLEKMKDVNYEDRTASVICVFALCDKNGKITTFEGKFTSKIALEAKGDNSFGFDEILECEKGKTFGELTDEEKIKINARGIAFRKLEEAIKNNLFVE